MVRFGNVINSSGSVIPLFLEQISRGGPLTITHPKITRYFMTIEEASYLVIQSSSIAKGGEILLLDMGKPVYIKQLAEKMISLSGLKIKNELNQNGDIEIIYTGMRPGEKLCEELLISSQSKKTIHPLIYRAQEEFINPKILFERLEKLKKSLVKLDKNGSINIMRELIPELVTKN